MNLNISVAVALAIVLSTAAPSNAADISEVPFWNSDQILGARQHVVEDGVENGLTFDLHAEDRRRPVRDHKLNGHVDALVHSRRFRKCA